MVDFLAMPTAPRALSFRSHVFFPVSLDGPDPELYSRESFPRYCHRAERATCGWYPLGRGQLLHNGIHFESASSERVFCMAPGRIIAARLGDDFSKDTHLYGSHRFVLVHHATTLVDNPSEPNYELWTTRDVQYYTLYMHLALEAGDSDVPWLRSFVPFLGPDAPELPPGVALLKANRRGGLGAYTAPERRGRKIREGRHLGTLPEGSIVEPLGGELDNWRRVRVRTERSHVTNPDDCWVKVDGNRTVLLRTFSDQVRALRGGGCAKLDYDVKGGELLGHTGVVDPGVVVDTRGVHVELFSATAANALGRQMVSDADLGRGRWTMNRDPDEDAIFDPPGFLARVQAAGGMGHRIADVFREHVYATDRQVSGYFSKLSDEDRASLRHLIMLNRSFWSVRWNDTMSRGGAWAKEFAWDQPMIDAAQRYMFWDACAAAGVALPRTDPPAFLCHYHPLGALEYIGERTAPLPAFYVVRSGEERICLRGADGVHENERVWAHDPREPKDLKFAWGWPDVVVGISRPGEPTLHDALDPAALDPRVPGGFTDVELRIWRAISHSEGGFDAVNTYDRAFLSFGPVQQTAGAVVAPSDVTPGELPGVLAFVKRDQPAAFQRYLGRYGLDVTAASFTTDKADEAFFVLNGRELRDGSAKEPLRDFVWGYRLLVAMRDPVFARPYLRKAFERIRTLRDITLPSGAPGQNIRLGDMFDSELSLALLLDAHINLPVLVLGRRATGGAATWQPNRDPIWIRALRNVLGADPDGRIRVETKRSDHETELAANIIATRGGMTTPHKRAAWIVLCVHGLDDALAGDLGYYTGLGPDGSPRGGMQRLYQRAVEGDSNPDPSIASAFRASLGGGYLRHPRAAAP